MVIFLPSNCGGKAYGLYKKMCYYLFTGVVMLSQDFTDV